MKEQNTMTLYEFYDRVIETSGLEVMTIGSLRSAIKNCMADLTSRGYKQFCELEFDNIKQLRPGLAVLECPDDIRKTLYLKAFFEDNSIKAERYALTNPKVRCTRIDGQFVSVVPRNGCIYYINNDKIYIEWDENLGTLDSVLFGYYARLEVPQVPDDIDADTINELKNYKFTIRKEFEDALVFYACYFYYARYIKDTDKMQFFLNNYKYYIEDIIHELSYEDDYYEEDSIIKVEDGI